MNRKELTRYSIAVAALVLLGLDWLGYRERRDRSADGIDRDRSGPASGGASDRDDSGAGHLPSKTGARPVAPKPAPDEEQKKFRRFFLPPLKFENASIEEAIATLIQAYRDAAQATGEQPLELQVDLSAARKDQRITCTTARGTIGPILKYLAAMAGNSTTGTLPYFKLLALDDARNKSGEKTIPADFVNSLKRLLRTPAEPNVSPDPFAPPPFSTSPEDFLRDTRPRDMLRLLGVGNDKNSAFAVAGESLTYQNLSAVDLQKLDAILDMSNNGGLGTGQIKMAVKVIDSPNSFSPLEDGALLTDQDLQQEMRRIAMTAGTDLMTMPSTTMRPDEKGIISVTREIPAAPDDEEPGWNGVRVTTTSSPLGLGQQTAFRFQVRDDGGEDVDLEQKVIVPEKQSAVRIQHMKDGRILTVIQTPTLIDGTGRPVADAP